ncbi:hypothetical protein PT286_04005 [Neisseriaceae bacterium ESL0693]|nr:hypothetical protein [Neisseriaceae bacterium ESL0693]
MVLMNEEDSDKSNSEKGYFAIKMADDAISSDSAAHQTLQKLSNQPMLFWYKQGDYLQLTNETGEIIGKLQQQFLHIDHQHYILEDLTGTL